MSDPFRRRTLELQRRLADEGIDLLLLTDPDSIFYVAAYWGDLGVEFGRPTVVAVPKSSEVTLITSSIEGEMCEAMTWVEDIRLFSDGVDGEWTGPLRSVLERYAGQRIAVERSKIPAVVSNYLTGDLGLGGLLDGTRVLSEQRMVKGPEEIAQIRQAGQVAVAMTDAARAVIAEGVPEYEIALAVQAGGTRKAAEIIGGEDPDSLMTPMIHNLQALNSGPHTAMAHRHPTVRRLERGDPVYLCFCSICHFKQFKLGYDREYFVGEMSDEHARIYEIALEAQQAAVREMRPGVTAEQVHQTSAEVYRRNGFGLCYRTGRAIGYSSLEIPELKDGDKTVLRPGMAFAVDGGITVPGKFGARVGDTILVTEDGAECVTESPRDQPVL
ncbi:MAG: Xaa-Pro peptidase family protein [Rhodospirillales bacterium]|nr:Xaa-Pro peptidase family protein [Rhodospirillales bacterium]MDH3792987.1 Xaa-Pro peptidase family protein [Rhodospirillales bacterium]MDH3920779.1 Xaa-Pro peptidase family protein [Rhodospirillales bacterium]MDH3968897.1 Xaa-Pro peptidase family protein [Rhodospirillales bacterium]